MQMTYFNYRLEREMGYQPNTHNFKNATEKTTKKKANLLNVLNCTEHAFNISTELRYPAYIIATPAYKKTCQYQPWTHVHFVYYSCKLHISIDHTDVVRKRNTFLLLPQGRICQFFCSHHSA
jgi:hypothetical protein